MTLQETMSLMKILSVTYPRDAAYNDPSKVANTAEVWTMLLEDLPVKLVLVAVKKHCLTSRFPPTIAEIREAATVTAKPHLQITAAEAWGEVMKAIRGYGYYREEEALESLSEQTRAVVKTIGWKDVCVCEEPDIIRGQFRRAYETMAARRKETALLPEEFLQLMDEIANDVTQKIDGDTKPKRLE